MSREAISFYEGMRQIHPEDPNSYLMLSAIFLYQHEQIRNLVFIWPKIPWCKRRKAKQEWKSLNLETEMREGIGNLVPCIEADELTEQSKQERDFVKKVEWLANMKKNGLKTAKQVQEFQRGMQDLQAYLRKAERNQIFIERYIHRYI